MCVVYWNIVKWILLVIFAVLPVSVRGSCGYPGSPAHSHVKFNTAKVEPGTGKVDPGTVAVYECEQGFELLGPPRRFCHQNGTWTPAGIPFCVLNVAVGKAPMQSSIVGKGSPKMTVDGNAELSSETCAETAVEASPWWYVNLLEPYLVQLVRVNFGKPCCGARPAVIVVRVGNQRPDTGINPICNRFTGFLEEGRPLFLPCYGPMHGAFVSVQLEGPSGNSLSICETFVYTDQALPIEHCPFFRDQPPGSVSTYHGKCYSFYKDEQKTFERARRFCRDKGGTLVNETSPALQGFLSWELYRRSGGNRDKQYWLGAVRDLVDRTTWRWLNDDPRQGNEVTNNFWKSSLGNGNCSALDGRSDWYWSDMDCSQELSFICQHGPTKCGAPERPPNSIPSSQELLIGSVLEYQCVAGHKLNGSQTRTCLRNGFLNNFTPKCIYVECEMPDTIANGYFKLTEGTKYFQSPVKYTCDEGFTLEGRARLNCNEHGKWNGPPPSCKAMGCQSPPTVVHGKYRFSNIPPVFRTTAQLECNPGYRVAGNSTLVCQANGSWEGEAPACKFDPDATQAPHVSTARVDHISTTSSPTTKRTTTTSTTTTTTTTTAAPVPSNEPDDNLASINGEQDPAVQTDPYYTESTGDDNYETSTELIIQSPSPSPSTVKPTARPTSPTPSHATTHRYNPSPARKKHEEAMSTTAKINLGGIIALGVFGGFVFLAAIITVIVIIVRRSRNKQQRSGNTSETASTNDGGNPETPGLHKHYKRAWDNLRQDNRRPKDNAQTSALRPSVNEALVSEATTSSQTAGRKSPAKERQRKPLSSRARLH